MERNLLLAGWLLLLCAQSGCGLLISSERKYVSNDDLLVEIATLSRYPLDPDLFKLLGVDARGDSISYQYRGVRFLGDHAWVVCYSEKSSEQDPVALANVHSLLPVISEGRTGFALTGEGEEKVGGELLRFITYSFDSPIQDAQGRPLPGTGVLGSVRTGSAGSVLVYQIKLDNYGDREEVTWDLLKPFLEAIRG
jgi:hypothetical protein